MYSLELHNSKISPKSNHYTSHHRIIVTKSKPLFHPIAPTNNILLLTHVTKIWPLFTENIAEPSRVRDSEKTEKARISFQLVEHVLNLKPTHSHGERESPSFIREVHPILFHLTLHTTRKQGTSTFSRTEKSPKSASGTMERKLSL